MAKSEENLARKEYWTEQVTQELMDKVVAKAVDGRIACEQARAYAHELDLPVALVGAAADKAGIRVVNCGLGCF